MFCPKCGKENKGGARFCSGCGSSLPGFENGGTYAGNPDEKAEKYKTADAEPSAEDTSGEDPTASLPSGAEPDQKSSSEKGSGKKKLIFICAGAAAVIIAAAVFICLYFFNSSGSDKKEYKKAAANYEEVEGRISELILSDNYSGEDTQTKASLALELLDGLEEEGEILKDSVEYDEEEQIICYCYADGSYGAILLEDIEEDTLGTGTDGFISEYDENGLISDYNRTPEFDISGSPFEDECSALIMYGAGLDQMLSLMQEDEQEWSECGIDVTLETECTVEKFRTMLAGYDYISIQLHGLLCYDKSTILLEEQADGCDFETWADRALGLVGIANMNDGTKQYFLMGEFFNFYYNDDENMDNTIVWIGCCDGFHEDSLVKGFSDAGAEAVIACTEAVDYNYECYMQDAFMYSLLCGNTVGESLDFAKSCFGDNDGEFIADYTGQEDTTPAEFRIYTDVDWNPEDITLVTLTQEAADFLETDETAVMYQLYYDKLMELQEEYGEAKLERMDETVTFEAGDGYWLYTYYWTGLFFAHLVDMDGDGTEELITGYYDPDQADTLSGYSLLTTGYTIDIWVCTDGGLQGYSLEPSQIGWSAIDGYIECQIGLSDDAAYVISSDAGGDLTRYEYYGLTGGTVEQIHSYDDSSGSIIVDGQDYGNDEDAYEDAMALVAEWMDEITDTQYWYFGGQYGLQDDISYFEDEYETEMAPAKEELDSTLAVLTEYPGIESSSSRSETAQEEASEADSSLDWAAIYLDFLEDEVSISEYEWLDYSETYSYEYIDGYLYDYVGFGLIYVNDDDIPELVMYGTSEATGMLIFTINEDGEIDVIMSERTWSFYYAEYGNMLVNSAGVTGWAWHYIYTIEDGSWVQLARGDYEYYDADADGVLEYYWNDEEVTEEEYQENLAEYEDGFSMTYPEDDPEYDLNGLKEYLNNQ